MRETTAKIGLFQTFQAVRCTDLMTHRLASFRRKDNAPSCPARASIRYVIGVLTFALLLVITGHEALAQSLDSKPPLIPGLDKPRSTGTFGASGSAVDTLPLTLAPGRKHVDPTLSFVYSSLGAIAELGEGFSLEIGEIVRSSSRGIPAESNVDEFIFSLAGSADTLVPLGGGAYRPRFESVFRQYQLVGGDHWEVRDAQGFLYVFGATPAYRIDGLEWMLERAEDPNGNGISVQYTQDGGYFYPNEIHYTTHGPTSDPGANAVKFDYEDRPDQRISYALGPRQVRGKRLVRVSNSAGGALVRRYEITYEQSATTSRSLVQSIDIVGADDVTTVNAKQYSYQAQTLGFQPTGPDGLFPVASYDGTGKDLGTRTVDVNGDGILDIVDNGTRVWLGDGSGHLPGAAPRAATRDRTPSACSNATHGSPSARPAWPGRSRPRERPSR